jgi:hypothetical protein
VRCKEQRQPAAEDRAAGSMARGPAVSGARRESQFRWLFLWLVLLAAVRARTAGAQSLLTGNEQNLVNFGFATQLGSGVYSASGRTLQIYRLPFGYTLRESDPDQVGIELTLPVTLGFYDFKLQDVATTGLPSSIDSLSFVPGVTLSYPVTPAWRLEPFIEGGFSRAQSSQANAAVYAGGLRSRYSFDARSFASLLYNDLVYAGVSYRGAVPSDEFARLRTAVTARRPFSSRSRADYLLYAMQEYYLKQPRGPIDSAESRGSPVQYEIGITFGATETWRIWNIPLPRVGVGYRFGPGLAVYRLVLGSPF